MLKVNNKSSNGVKENISWDVDLDVFSYIVIIPTKNSSWWRRLGQDQYIRLGYTSSRRLQDVFKTSSRHLQDVLPRRLQDVLQKRLQDIFKTSSRRLQNVFKTSWKTSSRHLQDVFKTSCKDIFKTFSRRIIKLNCSC